MSIHITQYGSGQPLVFFHGWGFDSQIWTSLIPLLQDNYQLYLVDLPGCGRSSSMSWSEFKVHLLTQLPAQFGLIGWSMGGLMATRLCIEEPERVSHLINVTSSPCFIQTKDWFGIDPAVFQAFYDRFILNPDQTRREFIQAQLQNQSPPPRLFITQPSALGLQAGLDLLLQWDLRKKLLELNKPVCYLFGRLDAIIPHQLMQLMQTNYPHFQYNLFRKAAHAPFLSHAHDFVSLLNEYRE